MIIFSRTHETSVAVSKYIGFIYNRQYEYSDILWNF